MAQEQTEGEAYDRYGQVLIGLCKAVMGLGDALEQIEAMKAKLEIDRQIIKLRPTIERSVRAGLAASKNRGRE